MSSNIYTCSLCKKEFKDGSNYRKHIKQKKTACIPQEEVVKLNQELKMEESKAYFFQTQVDKLKKEKEESEQEVIRLRKMMEKQIKNQMIKIESKMEQVNDTLENRFDNVEKQIEETGKFKNTINNCIINQQHNESNNNNFNFSLSLPQKERLDHISTKDVLRILNKDDFPESVGQLMEQVYFHPKAPENINWCVTDEYAAFGALEYNHESQTLIRKDTENVITRHLQYVLFGMSDMLEELRTSGSFNDQQGMNYSRFYNMVGKSSFDPDIVKSIKQKAYLGRNYAKGLWDRLQISVETNDLDSRVMMKSLKTTNLANL